MGFSGEFERIARAEGEAAAVAFAQREADDGDADALLALGNWRLWGAFGPRDLDEGYRLIARAAECGNMSAALAQAALLVTGTGADRDVGAARALVEGIAPRAALAGQILEILDRMPDAIPQAQLLSEAPYVASIDGLLTREECAFLIARATPRLKPVDGASIDPVEAAIFAPIDEDLVLHGINFRIAEATGTDVGQGEPLEVTRYRAGEGYRTWTDALADAANPRAAIVLIHLNEGYDGGETEFGALGIRTKGEPGDALIIALRGGAGQTDPRAGQAGLPVAEGEKWLAVRRIRARPFHPWKSETQV